MCTRAFTRHAGQQLLLVMWHAGVQQANAFSLHNPMTRPSPHSHTQHPPPDCTTAGGPDGLRSFGGRLHLPSQVLDLLVVLLQRAAGVGVAGQVVSEDADRGGGGWCQWVGVGVRVGWDGWEDGRMGGTPSTGRGWLCKGQHAMQPCAQGLWSLPSVAPAPLSRTHSLPRAHITAAPANPVPARTCKWPP